MRVTRGHLPLHFHGPIIGLHRDMEFRHDRPWTACRICGLVFQSKLDRTNNFNEEAQLRALLLRREWSIRHAKTHSATEHRELALSGRWLSPEAAQKLSSFGIIPLTDAVMDNEVEAALREAPRHPANDVEGG